MKLRFAKSHATASFRMLSERFDTILNCMTLRVVISAYPLGAALQQMGILQVQDAPTVICAVMDRFDHVVGKVAMQRFDHRKP